MHAIWDFPISSTPLESHPTIDYRINTPTLTQVITGRNFHYFKIRLHDIHRFFTKKKSWNQDYPPGQQIYSDDIPTSKALRAAIATEHSILYSGRDYRIGNYEGTLKRRPNEFFNLLLKYQDSTNPILSTIHTTFKTGINFILSKEDKLEDINDIYTYVLMDHSLRFSRCGAGTTVDMSSKHSLHAGGEPEVYYAGEFWIEKSSNQYGFILYMDNNSGTFAPPKDDLFRMKFLMESNFPGIPLIVLDYQDEEWKLKRKKK